MYIHFAEIIYKEIEVSEYKKKLQTGKLFKVYRKRKKYIKTKNRENKEEKDKKKGIWRKTKS